MRRVNVVYDDDFDDVDILLVPDYVADNIERIVNEFNHWILLPENHGRFVAKVINGYEVLGIGTAEFLWWLNHVKIDIAPKASIITQHTNLVPEFPCAEF